jgi:hypothetical protein
LSIETYHDESRSKSGDVVVKQPICIGSARPLRCD